jgi:hypothetical protein
MHDTTLPKQTKIWKNAFKREKYLDREWMLVAVPDCQQKTDRKRVHENGRFFTLPDILDKHTL